MVVSPIIITVISALIVLIALGRRWIVLWIKECVSHKVLRCFHIQLGRVLLHQIVFVVVLFDAGNFLLNRMVLQVGAFEHQIEPIYGGIGVGTGDAGVQFGLHIFRIVRLVHQFKVEIGKLHRHLFQIGHVRRKGLDLLVYILIGIVGHG